jgi:hypothetical protein
MTAPQNTPQAHSAGGVRTLRATILACRTQDDGACIMCADCGHIFVPSKPLTGESEETDNVTLAKALWYHMCATGRKQQPGRNNRT